MVLDFIEILKGLIVKSSWTEKIHSDLPLW